jgi:predicted lipid-binding transport protein (Tim44 family)
VGRRHRNLGQRRAPTSGERHAARRPASPGGSGLSRYLVDLAAILVIALAVNLVLREAGMVNALLRILLALIAGRVIVSLGRRFLESRR